ncbi:hypothetical protein BJV82DRAFT_655494 [Fennellomyces sp. T-0311]|nr:hypothetical protein BJV82DRAFT_655494 [Fennellomyces sp. T-0311]
MSASPKDKKRRWIESSDGGALSNADASAVSKPPLKKRFTANGKVSATSLANPSNEQSSVQPSSTSIPSSDARDDKFIAERDQLPKDALLKRMRSAKEETNALENQITRIDSQSEEFEVQRSVIRIQWSMLQSEILVLSRSLVDISSGPVQDLPKDAEDTARLEHELHKSQAAIRNVGMRILNFVRVWVERTDQLNQKQEKSALSQWVREEVDQLRASYERNQTLAREMENRRNALVEQSNSILNDIRAKEQQLEQAREKLYEYSEKLAQAEKRHDRSESAAVAALMATTGDSSTQRDGSPGATALATTTQKQETGESESSAALQTEAAKLQIAEHKLIVDTRTKELEDLQRERQTFLSDIERLRNEFTVLTDEQLTATEYFKSMQLSLEHYRTRASYLEEMKTQLDRELDEVTLERKKLVEEFKSEKLSQGMAMDAEMRRLEGDLARIRKQRDDFQTHVDAFASKKTRERQLHDEIIVAIEKEAEHIAHLEQQIATLRSAIKSCEQGGENPLKEVAEAYTELHAKLLKAKATIEFLEVKHGKQLSDNQAPIDAESLRRQLGMWVATDPAQTTDMHRNIQSLMEKIDKRSSESDKLQLMIDFFVKNETQLMTLIDRAGTIFTQLEEQSSKPIFDLTHKNEQKTKLQAEKIKFGHTFASLKAAKEKQMVNVAALRRTSEQQLDHIRQLEERERSLESQINEKESNVRQFLQNLETRRTNVEDLQQQCGELRIGLEHSDNFILELQKMVKEKTRTLDEERQLRKKVEEDYEKMQRKWTLASQGESPVQEQLQEEVEELRALLKCSSCQGRFRKRLLARCMHTFCKECIDTRLETRQRRCPTCGESFGMSDVRQFFLT